MSDLFKFKMSKTAKRVNFEMLGFIKEEKKDFRILNLKWKINKSFVCLGICRLYSLTQVSYVLWAFVST